MTEHTSHARTYYAVFAALLVLLVVTVAAALVDWGPLNIVIALAIAGVKIGLIAVYFMHLDTSRTSVRLYAASGAVWLLLLLVLLLGDYFTRGPAL